jgi:hypothetical protein
MATILPRVPTSSERYARALAGLGQGIAEDIPAYFQNKQETAEQNKFAKELGFDLSGIKDPEVRKVAFQEAIKGKSKKDRIERLNEMISQFYGANPQQQGAALAGNMPGQEQSIQQKDATTIPDELINAIAAEDPAVGRSIQKSKDVALREQREEKKAKQKKQEALRAETLPIRKEIVDRANIARRNIENKTQQIELIDTGKLNDPTFAQLMDSLPLKFGQRFLSPETVQYKGGLVQGYNELKSIFPGATRVKEIDILENKIPDIYLTDEQKKAIMKSSLDVSKVDLLREEAAAELEAEGKDYGILQFSKEVDKRAAPKINAIFNKFIDDQNAIIKNAENRKKIPLNANDPQDLEIIDQILEEAGGDWRKAEKLAKQKGYNF